MDALSESRVKRQEVAREDREDGREGISMDKTVGDREGE